MATMSMKALQFVLAAHYSQEELDAINELLIEKFDKADERENKLLIACSEVHATSIIGSTQAKEHEPTLFRIAEKIISMRDAPNPETPSTDEMFIFFDSMLATAVKHWFDNNNTNPPRTTTLKA